VIRNFFGSSIASWLCQHSCEWLSTERTSVQYDAKMYSTIHPLIRLLPLLHICRYCRFVVLPFVVWHSAAFESQAWLDQIERAFVARIAITVYVVFNGLLAFIFGLNVIHFRRLLFHPQLKAIFAQLSAEEKEKPPIGR